MLLYLSKKHFPQKYLFSNFFIFLFSHVHKIDSPSYRHVGIYFSKSMTTINKPYVGAPHFRQYAKGVRGSNYTFTRAILDLIDNAILIATELSIRLIMNEDSTAIERILIQDDVPHGFENIHESDSSSPLHIGHERDGQQHDGETSQYGRGLNDATMFLADRFGIYTRSISEKHGDTRVHVRFDYGTMIECTDASQSYEPAIFESMDESAFAALHPYGVGSTIYIENMRSNTDNAIGTPLECEANIINAIAQTYTSILAQNPDKNVYVNGKRVMIDDEISKKILNNPQCIERAITYKLMVTIHDTTGAITAISYKREAKNISYGRFNLQAGELEGQTAETADYNAAQNNFNAYKLTFMGTSTVDTPLSELQFKNYVRVIRAGRNHDDLPPEKNNQDGYNNHEFNCISYDSKQLNPFIGITSDKHVQKRNNSLWKCLDLMHRKLMSDLHTKKLRKSNSSSDESSVASARTSRRGRPPKNRAPIAEEVATTTPETAQVAAPNITAEPSTEESVEIPPPVSMIPTIDAATSSAIPRIHSDIRPEIQTAHHSDRENRYVKAPDARMMIYKLNELKLNHPRISLRDELLHAIGYIADHGDGDALLLNILLTIYSRYSDEQNVIGGALLSEIYQKYINDDDIVAEVNA